MSADRIRGLAACFIARDEEENLPAAIASVDFVEEVVVLLDDRTVDRSAEVVRASVAPGQTARVVVEEWRGHVAQKNAALARVSSPWVLCLDCDERVSPELRAEILDAFRAGTPGVAGYTCPRRTFHLGRWLWHGGWYPDRKLRLFRRALGRWEGRDPHDRLRVDGPVGRFRGPLLHYSYRDLTDHVERLDTYTRISARELYRRGVRWPLLRMLVHGGAKFTKAYFIKRGFLDGRAGLLLALLGSYGVSLKYAKLWELRRSARLARSHGAVKAEQER
jgi:glycosyltransferase involved in cell wall biosynthesis